MEFISNPVVEEKVPPGVNPGVRKGIGLVELIQTGELYVNAVTEGGSTNKSKSVMAKQLVFILLKRRYIFCGLLVFWNAVVFEIAFILVTASL